MFTFAISLNTRSLRGFSLVLPVFWVTMARGQAPGEAPAPPTDPLFTVSFTDGTKAEGRLLQLGPGGQLRLQPELEGQPGTAAPARAVPLDRVVSLERRGGDPPAWPPVGSVILFPEGDRLRAIIGAASETMLTALPPALGDAATPVPFAAMLGVILAPPSDPEKAGSLYAQVRDEPRTSELLWLSNGDRLAGSLLELGASAVKFAPDAGQVDVPRSSVVALGFDPALAAYPRPERGFAELSFLDGSRLGVTDTHLENGLIVATTRFGAEVRAPIAALSRIHVRGPGIVYLDERKEAASEFVPYFDAHPRRFGRNTTWDGATLRLDGEPRDRGLGMLPRTLVAYRLEPGDQRFQATVGLDDRAGRLGNVVFRVLVDGKPRFDSGPITGDQPPVEVNVDLAGARLLILAVEFGSSADIQDYADWIDARIIRAIP